MTKMILCVCSGNYCRSPIAEGLLRREIDRHGLAGHIAVHSAGTVDVYEGEPPAPLVGQVVSERRGHLNGHRPHQITPEEIGRADLVVAMAQEHVDYIARYYPKAASRAMLLSHAVGLSADVPDPGVQELGPLRECADLIEGYITRGFGEIVRRVAGKQAFGD
jgi:protein-tyrosine phosphatase